MSRKHECVMERGEFEYLRDLPGKVIEGDLILRPSPRNPYWLIDRAPIINAQAVPAELEVLYNPRTGSKTISVFADSGPICRLDVDGTNHAPFGRSHKHALLTATCPSENLHRDIQPRPELSGEDIEFVFRAFCSFANILHRGAFQVLRSSG